MSNYKLSFTAKEVDQILAQVGGLVPKVVNLNAYGSPSIAQAILGLFQSGGGDSTMMCGAFWTDVTTDNPLVLTLPQNETMGFHIHEPVVFKINGQVRQIGFFALLRDTSVHEIKVNLYNSFDENGDYCTVNVKVS